MAHQGGFKSGSNQQALSGHSFRVGAALDFFGARQTFGEDYSKRRMANRFDHHEIPKELVLMIGLFCFEGLFI
jgi:hypothetical protein